MAEAVISVLVEAILGKLGPLALKEIVLPFVVKHRLEKLREKLEEIQAVLCDAEEQQETNQSVKIWLGKLKGAVYDAEDLLDEIAAEALRWKVDVGESMVKKVRIFFTKSNPVLLRYKIGHKINDVMEKINEVAASMSSFGFLARDPKRGLRYSDNDRDTHSFERAANVIGRSHDERKIVEYLQRTTEQDVSVVAIVGIGGVGKTTLARLVYNNDEIVTSFELRMWARVSESFDLKTLLGKILKSATDIDHGDLELDQLQKQLREELKDKRFLLVLDDHWSESRSDWDKVKELLIGNGAKGSKIIVTTRNEKVASTMDAYETYQLKGLSHDDCWKVLMRCAFKEGEEKIHPRLQQIGKDIAKNCGGIPLAARTLGGMLYSKTDEKDWLYILTNEMWKLPQQKGDILPVLTLSYNLMPPYLKQCFAYCSLFPKGRPIYRELLIQLWMAQGFIQLPDSDQSHNLEDIGNMYFNQLLSRCFFQEVNEAFDSKVLTCTAHDLVLDLSRSVGAAECSLASGGSANFAPKIRHVSYLESSLTEKELVSHLPSKACIRTLLFPLISGSAGESYLEELISRFTCLRTLDLSGSDIENLPCSIGKLRLLRFLDLSRNRTVKFLPASICKLHNLQTLKLFGCEKLTQLPDEMKKLVNLRHLDITLQKQSSLGKWIGGLTNLRSLLIAGCNDLVSLADGMQNLSHLRNLRIVDCESLASLSGIGEHLVSLESLVVWDCPNLVLTENCLDGLEKIQSLDMGKIPKLVNLPQGIEKASQTLQYLSISSCAALVRLPEWLGNLKFLRKLEIVNCRSVRAMPESIRLLTKLKSLFIVKCPELNKRCRREIGPDWPYIAHVPEIFNEADAHH